jgi:hypothetical protein
VAVTVWRGGGARRADASTSDAATEDHDLGAVQDGGLRDSGLSLIFNLCVAVVR